MPPPSAPVRLAVVSTPRAGNTWVRGLLADAYQVPQVAAHALTDAEWQALPGECVLQLHARREPAFCDRLRGRGFRVVTVARHPLDVLVSVLHFSLFDPDTHRWLGGRGGDEDGIAGATPRSRAFVEYASGPRAAELLAVSADWWGRPGVVGVRYEDCVADPVAELGRLTAALGPPRAADLTTVVDGLTLGRQRRTSVNGHFWQGRPGLWRTLLPAAEACEIASARADLFAALGYACDPDPGLDAAAADRNWVRLVGPDFRAAARRAVEGFGAELTSYRAIAEAAIAEQAVKARRAVEAEENERALRLRTRAEANRWHAEVVRLHGEIVRLIQDVAERDARFAPYAGLQGASVRVARWLQAVRDRCPRAAGWAKAAVGRQAPAA